MKNKNKEVFYNYMKRIDDYKLLSEFKGKSKKITLKHELCGRIYETTPTHFMDREQRCKKCSGVNIERSQKFIEKLKKETLRDGYVLIGEYKNSKTKITIKHLECNSEYDVKPENFLSGRRCPYCYAKEKKGKPINKIPKNFYNNIKGRYDLMSEFISTRDDVSLKCLKCNTVFITLPRYFDNGSIEDVYGKCPNCIRRFSNGENKVYDVIKDLDCDIISEYSFPDCVDINPLRFDFAIFKDDQLICLIEYQGEQHYKYNDFFFKNKEHYERVINRDNIKRKYCEENNHVLIEVPYWEKDINSFLKNKFKQVGITNSLIS